MLIKLAAGLGELWTRNGGIPQGCPLSMMFIVALHLPWSRYLAAQEEGLSRSYMLTILSASLGIQVFFCVLLGLLLVMCGWLVRSLLIGSVCL